MLALSPTPAMSVQGQSVVPLFNRRSSLQLKETKKPGRNVTSGSFVEHSIPRLLRNRPLEGSPNPGAELRKGNRIQAEFKSTTVWGLRD